MTAYQDYVSKDLDRIEVRAVTLYALSKNEIPWPLASSSIRGEFKERAGNELWQEGVLKFDPSEPYYEDRSGG